MGILRKYWEIIKLAFKYVRFKIRQSYLKTSEKCIVTTTYGPIKGIKRISIWNDPFYSFEKIPFAKPPIGELRFKAPVPPDPWTKAVDCTCEGPIPAQTNLITKRVEGSEDCLHLNVYTKNVKPNKLMPVMVWIYGGGFENGGATKDLYSPDYFMQKDIVLIEITYRVGPFGFLTFNDPDLNIPGNAGLKDQVFALKWVKNNCSIFGGDPQNITVFGESAGGASTHYMTITEQTKGLFHKAILMSGNVLCPWALHPDKKIGYRLAKNMGYNGGDTDKEIYEFLKNSNSKAILKGEKDLLTPYEKRKRVLLPFGPVIEPYKTDECVIPEDPRIMMRTAWSNQIPFMIGGTSYEGLLFYPETKLNPDLVNSLEHCTDLVPMELNLDDESPECLNFGLKLRNCYFKGEQPNIEKIHNYLDLMSYKAFWHPIHRTLLSRLKYAPNTSTYLYRFDVDSKFFNWLRILFCGTRMRGVCHGDDLGYLFLHMWAASIKPDTKEYQAIQEFLGAFTRFAENGNPNSPSTSSSDETLTWKPCDKNDNPFLCYNFNFNSKIIPLPETDKIKIWDSFYPEELLI